MAPTVLVSFSIFGEKTLFLIFMSYTERYEKKKLLVIFSLFQKFLTCAPFEEQQHGG
jgi:hypothetical protein